MNLNRVMGVIFVVAGAAFALATALRGQTQSGDWTIHRSDEPGKVEVSIMDSRGGHHFHSSSDWEVKELTGLDLSKPGRQDAHFTITRDAGRFECEGFVKDGEGAGVFHFLPDAKYVQRPTSAELRKSLWKNSFTLRGLRGSDIRMFAPVPQCIEYHSCNHKRQQENPT